MPKPFHPVDFPSTVQLLRDAKGSVHVLLAPNGHPDKPIKLTARENSHSERNLATFVFAQQVNNVDLSGFEDSASARPSTSGAEQFIAITRYVFVQHKVWELSIRAHKSAKNVTYSFSYELDDEVREGRESAILRGPGTLHEKMDRAAFQVTRAIMDQVAGWSEMLLVAEHQRKTPPFQHRIPVRKLDLGQWVSFPRGSEVRLSDQSTYTFAANGDASVYDLKVSALGYGVTYLGTMGMFTTWYSLADEVVLAAESNEAEGEGLPPRQSPIPDPRLSGGQLYRMRDPFARNSEEDDDFDDFRD